MKHIARYNDNLDGILVYNGQLCYVKTVELVNAQPGDFLKKCDLDVLLSVSYGEAEVPGINAREEFRKAGLHWSGEEFDDLRTWAMDALLDRGDPPFGMSTPMVGEENHNFVYGYIWKLDQVVGSLRPEDLYESSVCIYGNKDDCCNGDDPETIRTLKMVKSMVE